MFQIKEVAYIMYNVGMYQFTQFMMRCDSRNVLVTQLIALDGTSACPATSCVLQHPCRGGPQTGITIAANVWCPGR